MKQFIKRVSFFIGLLMFTLFLLRQSVPFYRGNPIIQQKMQYALDHTETYDTYFIGSSSIYRQVDPVIFDEITQLRSFNLGFDAMFFLEAHFLADHFLTSLETISEKPITLFLSEITPHQMTEQNLHNIRNKYYMDFKRLIMAIQYYWQQKNYRQLYFHCLSYLENQLMLGEISTFLTYHLGKTRKIQPEIIKQYGFYPMDQELELEQKQNLLKNHTAFLKSDKYLKRKNLTKEEISDTHLTISSNLSTYENINSKLATFYQIPVSIGLGPKYEFDFGHLDAEGAAIFSRKLGEAYNRVKK